jgi:hypothetical protein
MNADWKREAIRLHYRYVVEIVEACGLCPWAERARTQKRLREEVILEPGDADAISRSLAALDRWANDGNAEIGFLLFPRSPHGRDAFASFTARLRDADAERHELGAIPFVLAAFHPDSKPDDSDPERMIPFLRRSPDACVQVLRTSVLEKVRSSAPQGTQLIDVAALEALITGHAPPPPLRERIARANLETARRIGIDELRRRLDAIRADRNSTYRDLPPIDVLGPGPQK